VSIDNASSRFKIGEVNSSKGDVLVNAADGIYAGYDTAQITGELVELDAFRGAIGSESRLLHVDSDIDGIAKTGGFTARARGDIHVMETNAANTAGNLKLVQARNWDADASVIVPPRARSTSRRAAGPSSTVWSSCSARAMPARS
jgi:hypothetical protein